MASNINPSLTPVNSLTNFKFWCQKVLPLVYDDSLSYYEVLGKMVVQLNDVIDNVNADTENVLTLKDAFLELQTYVNNFFDDIDQLASYAERAEAAQTAANTSAVNAASSASNASASSLAAMDARDTAVAARQAAQASANTASTAATNANTKANEAAQSAITAQTAQASASESATLAATDRSAAQTAANTATTKASEANTSATNAETSASNAENAANRVEESANQIATNTANINILKETYENKKVKILAGAIRNSGNGWEFIDDTGHQQINMISVGSSADLRINYGFTAKKVVTFLVTPDETFAEKYSCGASVGDTYADIRVFEHPFEYEGKLTYSEGTWNADNAFLGDTGRLSYGYNSLIIYHDSVANYPANQKYNISINAYGCEASISSVTDTGIVLSIANITEGASIYFSRSVPVRRISANYLTSQSGNFWIIGVMEIE